ncbi:unnamed protein product, partial [Trichobilharzia regenti]
MGIITRILSSIIKNQSLDDEMLETFLCEAKRILNDPPLLPVRDDVKNFDVLVPNKLLLVRDNPEFVYVPDANVTFDTWFRKYKYPFRVDFADKDDAWKVRLLLHELYKYCNLILPQKPNETSFAETVHTLRHRFGDQRSLFNIRYHCMELVLNENDDIRTQLGIFNRTCERFKLKSLSEDQFKVLIFICGLQSPKFADIRTRPLNRLEQDPRMTLKDVGEEYQIPSTSTAPSNPQHKPPSHKCRRCHTVGHKDDYCKLNNQPRRRHMPKSLSVTAAYHINAPASPKYIDMTINTPPARLQIDTASNITIISKRLWQKLGCPAIEKTNQIVFSACGGRLRLNGEIKCSVGFHDSHFVGTCYINNSNVDVLSLNWPEKLHLSEISLSSVCHKIENIEPSTIKPEIRDRYIT